MKIRDNLEGLVARHPEVYEAYEAYGRAVHEGGGPLEERTRWLVKVAVSAALGLEKANVTHLAKALRAGCTVDEIEHALLLVAPTAGFPRMMEAMERWRALLADPDRGGLAP